MTIFTHLSRQMFFAFCVVAGKVVPARGVPVLVYHSIDDSGSLNSVSPAAFARQMKHLQHHGWTTLSLNALLTSTQHQQSPSKRVLLTFDDGYQNVRTQALPVLHACGFTATLFLTTATVGGRNSFARAKMPDLPMLTWPEVRTLRESGWQIESHGHTHTDLSQLDRTQLYTELTLSREHIQTQTGVCPKHFCYPRGKYTPDVLDAVRTVGYESAMSLHAGFVTSHSNLWRLERLWVADTGLLHFGALLSQPYVVFRRLWRGD